MGLKPEFDLDHILKFLHIDYNNLSKWLILWEIPRKWQLEEVDFFHEICLIVLHASRAVKFAAVVDCKGKLILAKFKKINMHHHTASLLSSSRSLDGSSPQRQQDQTLLPQSCHSFYHEHLMPTLKDITSRSYRERCIQRYLLPKIMPSLQAPILFRMSNN